LRCLGNYFEGHYGKAKLAGRSFTNCLKILSRIPVGSLNEPKVLFKLYFQPDWKPFELRYTGGSIDVLEQLPGVTIVPSPLKGYASRVYFRRSQLVPDAPEVPPVLSLHPFFVLRGPLYHRVLPNRVRLACSPTVALKQDLKKFREHARHEFAQFLIKETKGSVRMLVSNRINPPMVELGKPGSGEFLYGYTLVLPWALDYITQASCLMTDTTFKCCRPYCLSLLLAIVANESIVIGWSVSPTECTGAYERLRSHIDEIIANPVPPEDAKVTFMGDEPQIPQGRDFEDKAEHLAKKEIKAQKAHPNLIPNPQSDDEDDDEADATDLLRSSDGEDETTEEEEEVGDEIEAVPDPGGMPAPDGLLFPEQFAFDPDLLQTLPLVTDQGTALASLVNKRHLQWKLCHRHIIQSVGPKSHVGRCVVRLLRCNSPQHYRRLVRSINRELEVVYPGAANLPTNIGALRAMLNATEDDHPQHVLGDIRLWARWHRTGI
jgi:hypothetical protein